MKSRPIGMLSLGHMVTDINQGALPAMLPFFITAHDLSYTAAAGIVFAANMTSSIVQPLFGFAADRFSKPWLLSAGLLLAGLGLGLTGLAKSYVWIMCLAIISGIGIAAYHPEAARLVNFAAGDKKGTAMSLFGVGGTIGFAIGPLVVTTALLQWGLPGTLVLIIPVCVMALLMAGQFSLFASLAAGGNKDHVDSETGCAADHWGAFSRLTTVIVGRSIIFYGLNTFIPIYWITVLHQNSAVGAIALTVFAISGILGNLLGGSLADRIGQKKVLLLGLFGLTLLMPLLVLVQSAPAAMLLLVPIGLLLHGTYSPSIVLGQTYLPNRVGFSSGVTLGIAVAIGGGAAPIIGKVADIHGIGYAMAAVACFPVVPFIIALSLPAFVNRRVKTSLDGAK